MDAVITTPVGRMVGGSVYKPKTTDASGKPLAYKTGNNAGQPRVEYYVPLAIPKGAEQHWAQTAWGAIIWAAGHAGAPQAAQSPAFAWKITDGDSTVPNKKGNKPCDQTGYKGHWVLHFSNGFAPRLLNKDGTQVLVEADVVKPGHYIQINGTIAANGSAESPGIYLNLNMVAWRAFGEEISSGPDGASVGFGAAPLPAGASATPVGGAFNPAPPVVAGPAYVPPFPGATVGVPAVGPGSPPPLAVAPNPAFAGMPPPATIPGPPIVGVPARAMTAKAAGFTYEQLIGQGWTPELLVQHGYMVA